jgi:pimeloyl-ACP methyl ester carboxylesterase
MAAAPDIIDAAAPTEVPGARAQPPHAAGAAPPPSAGGPSRTRTRRRIRRVVALVALGLGAVALAIGVPACVRYQRDMDAARARLRGLGSQVVATRAGPIEYATYGMGPPVLVVHGVLGGFDQGLYIARMQVGDGFTSIAPSRFGYLRTPLPDDASAATQADAHAALLDALGIGRVAVLGTSAGTASAIQFALRYPDRTAALVLTSMSAGQPAPGMPKRVARALFGSGFVMWAATTYFPSQLHLGSPTNAEEQVELEEGMALIHPAGRRVAGKVFDDYVSTPSIRALPLGKVKAPTLVVNAVDDGLVQFDDARAMAGQIPGATLIAVERGGHLLLGQTEQVRAAVTRFLAEYGPAAAGPRGEAAPD